MTDLTDAPHAEGRARAWWRSPALRRAYLATGAALAVLVATFSYTPFTVLVSGTQPSELFARFALWTAVVLLGYVAYRRFMPSPPPAWWRGAGRMAAMVVTATAMVLVVTAVALPADDRTRLDLLRITMVGVLGEEVLFRGLVWDAVARTAPCRRSDLLALGVTSGLFSLAHLQYHGFALTTEAVGQLGYTLVAGVVLGWLRLRTGGLALPLAVHAGGNAALQLVRYL